MNYLVLLRIMRLKKNYNFFNEKNSVFYRHFFIIRITRPNELPGFAKNHEAQETNYNYYIRTARLKIRIS